MKIRINAPSWGIVAGMLTLAAVVWVSTSGPDMVGPRALEWERRAQNHDPVQTSLGGLVRERREIQAALARADWVDEFIPRTLDAQQRGEPIALGWPEEMATVQEDLARELVQHPMLKPVTSERVALGLFAVESARANRTMFFGTEGGTPYCIMLEGVPGAAMHQASFPRDAHPRTEGMPSMLQACTWIRRYGIPGELIGDWFEVSFRQIDSGMSERESRASTPLRWDDFSVPALLAFGPRPRGMAGRACRGGTSAACSLEWQPSLGSRAPEGTDRMTLVAESFGSEILAGLSRDLLSRMQDDFGEEAMLDFWTSDQSFEQAFQDAFGLHPNAWVQDLAIGDGGPVRAGPMPVVGGSVMGLLLSIASVLVAIFLARLRRVG